jgi:hypothetical protein
VVARRCACKVVVDEAVRVELSSVVGAGSVSCAGASSFMVSRLNESGLKGNPSSLNCREGWKDRESDEDSCHG